MKAKRRAIAVAASVLALAVGASSAAADDGGLQSVGQEAGTIQLGGADATANQNGVNANAPVQIGGGDVTGGASSANQTLDNSADANANNEASTDQTADVSQSGSGSSCAVACGGSGYFQAVDQTALTGQVAYADADADQNAVNANVPVQVGGGDVTGGASSANQTASNSADAEANNEASTDQTADVSQSGGGSSCAVACGGSGYFQVVDQKAITLQAAKAAAAADQNGVNANAPVQIGGGDVTGGASSANQTLDNSADANANNEASTDQTADVSQSGGGSSCAVACGGSGYFQAVDQTALTGQVAYADADADQNAVNANVPVQVGGGDVTGGASSANQTASNSADAEANNEASTTQTANASQGGHEGSCLRECGGGCHLACGSSGYFQAVDQTALTGQVAYADADADQNAVNANVPVQVGGGDVTGGASSANQTASNSADAEANNEASTDQTADVSQSGGGSSCAVACGGSGYFQVVDQKAITLQAAKAAADADQNGVNANAPVQIGGGDVTGGASSANQTLDNSADANANNEASTTQTANASQGGHERSCLRECGGGCHLACGSSGYAQKIHQSAYTLQFGWAFADAWQNAVNSNTPSQVAGGNALGGASSANQTGDNGGGSETRNTGSSNQNATAGQPPRAP